MQPLSRRKRHFYLYGLIALFAVLLPLVILYASGYRFKSGLGIVRTGGIYVSVSHAGAVVLMDGKPIGESGLLNRGFYIDDLTPGAYTVSAEKDGYYPWAHTLVVEQQIVTDANAFLVPKTITPRLLSPVESPSTTTIVVSRRAYDAYAEAFITPMATSTPDGALDVSGDEAVFVERGNVFVRWMNKAAQPTSNFCGRPSFCIRQFAIEESPQTATGAAYFAGGVVFRTKEGGVFIREATVRSGAVLAPIYARRGADFRIVDGALIIKEGNRLYQVTEL